MGARERSGAFSVDVQVADVEPPSRLLDAVAISCEDRTGQAELRAVRDVERVVEVTRADDREHRPEDLLLRDACARADVVEDRRLDVIAAFTRTTAEHERALRAADVDVLDDLAEGRVVDQRTEVGAALGRIAEPQPAQTLDDAGDELVMDGVDDDRARARRALLPLVAEGARHDRLGCTFEGGRLVDEDRVLPAQLELDALDPDLPRLEPRRALVDADADVLRAGEGDESRLRWSTSASPMRPPDPASRLITPAGAPHSPKRSTSQAAA